MALSLNIHTGYTGLVNFGVIFFVAIGAIVPTLLNRVYGLNSIVGMFLGVLISAFIGYLLAFPSLKLRTDYFAIVTISLGAVLQKMMVVEPWLRTSNQGSGISVPGIADYQIPFSDWWKQNFPTIPFFGFQALFGLSLFLILFILLEYLGNSPYGRVLRTIREDEDVTKSYGYNIFQYKAVALAIGAGVAAFAGSLWAWELSGFSSQFLDPVTTTFVVWAAFVMGGRGNNKGMVIGSFIIVLTNNLVTTVSAQFQANSTSFYTVIIDFFNSIYRFWLINIEGTVFGNGVWLNFFNAKNSVSLDLNYLQLSFVGIVILVFTRYFEKGVIPELPYRPKRKLNAKIPLKDIIDTSLTIPSSEMNGINNQQREQKELDKDE